MAIARILKRAAVFTDRQKYVGEVKSVTLYEPEEDTEDIRRPIGNVAIKTGLKQPILKIKSGGGFMFLHAFGLPNWGGAGVRFVGSYEDQDGTISTIEVDARGTAKKLGRGDHEVGKVTEDETEFHCQYYKETINGRTIIEIDYENDIEIINGVDNMEVHRLNTL